VVRLGCGEGGSPFREACHCDLREVSVWEITNADIIFGKFPCQPFSPCLKRCGVAVHSWILYKDLM
jgi:site-specific DNA-cytosine methylase